MTDLETRIREIYREAQRCRRDKHYDAIMKELEVRLAAMQWLERRPAPLVDWAWANSFRFDGEPVVLISQSGIVKPKSLNAAISIRTTYRGSVDELPYDDAVGADGLQRYKYRGTDPDHYHNRALRRAFRDRLPLIWFVGVAKGLYEPIFPVYVIGDDPSRLEFTLALDDAQLRLTPDDLDTRDYALRITKQRLHQPVFRRQVLLAYDGKCSICRLKHVELLDAAHILADTSPRGLPVVPNGISLCKIHHAAFDNNILGIRPDLTLHVRDDVMQETDGWMLAGGIQGVHNKTLEVLPRMRAARPDADRLEERYAAFLAL